jgi:hypothetical protein
MESNGRLQTSVELRLDFTFRFSAALTQPLVFK